MKKCLLSLAIVLVLVFFLNVIGEAKDAWEEQQSRGFSVGNIDLFLARGGGGYTVVRRTPKSAIFTSVVVPGRIYALFQTASIQGHDILLGPIAMPEWRGTITPQEYINRWQIFEPAVLFDENKNYSAPYYDYLNYAAMFVIKEHRPEGDVPIQALYYQKWVQTPNLVNDKTNEDLKMKGFSKSIAPELLKNC